MLDTLIQEAHLTDVWSQSVTARPYGVLTDPALTPELIQKAQDTITAWPDYTPTPLHSLQPLANACGVHSILYKDESQRFALGSFKALGGAFAILDWAAGELSKKFGKQVSIEAVRRGDYQAVMQALTVATATDGNHGRSVAWGAQLAGCDCKIFIHRDVSEGRERAMAEFGADITRINGDYDESVRQCAKSSAAAGWQIISDTSWPGYTEIPRAVMAGYTVMVGEMLSQMDEPPTHVIVQAGVGGLAAGVMSAWWNALNEACPKLIIVESDKAACIYQSLLNDTLTPVPIEEETVMAGLSCGEVSQLAWPVLHAAVTASVTIADKLVPMAMQCFANEQMADQAIESGECGVPGAIALAAIMKNDAARTACELNEHSRVQLFGCEGATDPAIYNEFIQQP